jgi:ATP-dependent DNA helicase DinG
MTAALEEALRSKRHAVLEAGTGVGKSFAYLVPVILHATSTGTPVVVCTSTISLQEQLVHKDLPFLEKALPTRFTYALLKGRTNYLCARRLDLAVRGGPDFFDRAEDADALARIVEWSRTTREGSLSDLESQPPYTVWDKVCSEHGNCLGRKCERQKGCFYQAARRAALKANVIVANYALYFADLALRREGSKFLPDHPVVVFDEAHEVESLAAEHLGHQVSFFQVKYLLDCLLNPSGRKGFLKVLGAPALYHRLIGAARDAADAFFEGVLAWSRTRAPANLRIRERAFVPDPLSAALAELRQGLEPLAKTCRTEGEASELNSYMVKALALADAVGDIVLQKSGGHVYWAEVGETSRSFLRIAMKSCPVDVAPILGRELFAKRDTVVCTSATLATAREGGFDYFRRAMGMPDAVVERRVDSPFNYREQATLVLCPKIPDPREADAYLPPASAQVVRHVRGTEGRAFVLFTSYALMKAMRDRVGPQLAEWDIRILFQGEGTSRSRMLQEFKAAEGANLAIFGVDSFWQGVDVPGAALSTVVITKLPFPVPGHPLVEAKAERIREAGGNPFEDYYLPESILKLKQGFGRLIRRKDDRGTVVVLDSRVVTKGYGRKFLAALPPCKIVYED